MNGTRQENLLMRASAGTGKTYQLSTRYLQLLCQGSSVEQILATTFTRKAAGEILQRIVQRLTEAAGNPARCQQLAQALGLPQWTCRDANQKLRELTRNLHRVRVSTFDSFFAQLARAFSLELGLAPGWRIVAEHELRTMRQRSIHNLLVHHDTELTLEIIHLLKPGELSRSVSADIDQIASKLYDTYLETGDDAWQAELLSCATQKPYTRETLQAAYDDLLQLTDTCEDGLKKTLIKFCDSVGVLLEDPYQLESWLPLIRTGIPAKIIQGEETFNRKLIPSEVKRAYMPFIDHFRRLARSTFANRIAATGRLLSAYHVEYQKEQEIQQSLAFADVVYHLARAGWSDPGQWTFRLDTNLDHLLLDEFQDTSAAQWSILRPLVHHLQQHPTRRSLFCVGDVKQAIYGWRGGDSRIFQAVQRDVSDIREHELAASFRSCPAVIDAVNQVFSRLDEHPDLKDWQDGIAEFIRKFPQHTTHRSDLDGEVTLSVGPTLNTSKSNEDEVDETEDDDATEGVEGEPPFVKHVAAAIQNWHLERPDAEIAVLVRKNQFASQIAYALKRLGLNVSDEGRSSLQDSPAVQLILSALRLADHPGDTFAWFHLAASPWGHHLGLSRYSANQSAGELAALWRRRLMEQGYGPTIAEWVQQLGPLGTNRDERRLERLREIAFAYDSDATLRTHDFLNRILNDRLTDPTAAPIRVMTVHASKGLQFDIVVLPELHGETGQRGRQFVVDAPEPGQPARRIIELGRAEVRAVMPPELQRVYQDYHRQSSEAALSTVYVAMTRAIHALHMIIPGDPKATDVNQAPKLNRKFSGLIHFGLAPTLSAMPGTMLYARGNPNWKLPDVTKGRQTAMIPTLPSIHLRPANSEHSRGSVGIAPSSREGSQVNKVSDLLNSKPSKVFLWGTLAHAWLARIRWLADASPTIEELHQIAQPYPIDSSQLERHIGRFQSWLTQPPLLDVLTPDTYRAQARSLFPPEVRAELSDSTCQLEARNESAIAYFDDHRLISGSIDRLILWKRAEQIVAATVIDYKTDGLDNDQMQSERTKFYAPQLAAYRQAIQSMLRLPAERVQTQLVFLPS